MSIEDALSDALQDMTLRTPHDSHESTPVWNAATIDVGAHLADTTQRLVQHACPLRSAFSHHPPSPGGTYLQCTTCKRVESRFVCAQCVLQSTQIEVKRAQLNELGARRDRLLAQVVDKTAHYDVFDNNAPPGSSEAIISADIENLKLKIAFVRHNLAVKRAKLLSIDEASMEHTSMTTSLRDWSTRTAPSIVRRHALLADHHARLERRTQRLADKRARMFRQVFTDVVPLVEQSPPYIYRIGLAGVLYDDDGTAAQMARAILPDGDAVRQAGVSHAAMLVDLLVRVADVCVPFALPPHQLQLPAASTAHLYTSIMKLHANIIALCMSAHLNGSFVLSQPMSTLAQLRRHLDKDPALYSNLPFELPTVTLSEWREERRAYEWTVGGRETQSRALARHVQQYTIGCRALAERAMQIDGDDTTNDEWETVDETFGETPPPGVSMTQSSIVDSVWGMLKRN